MPVNLTGTGIWSWELRRAANRGEAADVAATRARAGISAAGRRRLASMDAHPEASPDRTRRLVTP